MNEDEKSTNKRYLDTVKTLDPELGFPPKF